MARHVGEECRYRPCCLHSGLNSDYQKRNPWKAQDQQTAGVEVQIPRMRRGIRNKRTRTRTRTRMRIWRWAEQRRKEMSGNLQWSA